MRRYVIRRILQAVAILFVMSMAFFGLLHAIPGGPTALIGVNNPRFTPALRQAIIHRLGLDQPLPKQYLTWVTASLHGDFGNSLINGRPVGTEISERLGPTIELFLAAWGVALILAILLGIVSAVKQYSLTDTVITVIAYIGIAMPVFWFALILQELFGVRFHLLPVYGQHFTDQTGFSQLDIFEDYFLHLILPATVLAFLYIGQWSRYLRSSMLEVLKQDYIRTARAKGLSARKVLFGHAFRNALIPLVTIVALNFGGIIGGAVVTETVFAWPGMGSLFIAALNVQDYPILLAYLVLGSASVIVFNLIADILYAVIDPRIRYS